MFIGQFEYNLDEKGRVSIPGKFREKLPPRKKETTLVVARDLDHCLAVYPEDAWLKVAEKIQNLPRVEEDVQRFVRFFFSTAEECPLDKQGRILLSPELRRYAALEREIIFLGNFHKFEIWNRESWRAQEAVNANPETQNRMKQLLVRFGF
ncbi:MAG TPA: division/cell wall cluster transcriptional repressor MraZ [Nitrospiria bacterium]|nr:division/cell wall cluster transcriptional repressor MraZ [Nitrospiria bacterium]